MKKEHLIQAEITTLEQFLQSAPASSMIQQMIWENRLKRLRKELENARDAPPDPHLHITFAGRPVRWAGSIDAHFATQIVSALAGAIDTLAATLGAGSRDREDSGIRIRLLHCDDDATAACVLELPPWTPRTTQQAELFPPTEEESLAQGIETPGPYTDAINRTLHLLHQATLRSEHAIAASIAGFDWDALDQLRTFLNLLRTHGAMALIAFRNETLALDNPAAIETAIQILSPEAVSVELTEEQATLTGVAPSLRTFEAMDESCSYLTGFICHSIPSIDQLAREWEHKEATLKLTVITVGTAEHLLLTAIEPPDDEDDDDGDRDAAHSHSPDLETDLLNAPWIIAKVRASDRYAQDLYASLCNQDWLPTDRAIAAGLHPWGSSFRYSGKIIAKLRGRGSYLDWYLSTRTSGAPEGTLTDEVRQDLAQLGWRPTLPSEEGD